MKKKQSVPLRVCLAQINCVVGDLSGNRDLVLQALVEARLKKADLVVFPELTLTGYPPEDIVFKDHFIEDNLKALRQVASATGGLTAVVGYTDRGKNGCLHNCAAVLHDGRHVFSYRKMELPNYGVFDEKRTFTAGDRFAAIQLKGLRIGLTICEDIWLEHGRLASSGLFGSVSALLNLSASPYHAGKQKERLKLFKKVARRAQAPLLYANLVGGQDELVFDGGSLIMHPKKGVLAEAHRFEKDLLFADLYLTPAGKKPSSYGEVVLKPAKIPAGSVRTALGARKAPKMSREEEVYKALVLGTRDYIQKNGFRKVLLGLSGGIDSALVLAIAADAIGPSNVIAVTMPSRYTSQATYKDALRLAQNYGVECLEVPIGRIFDAYLADLRSAFKGRKPDSAEENLQARIRGNLLMALSNKFGHLVLTTGNKSEMATGYCTLYGDMAGGYAVIKDVPKTLVYRLVNYRNRLTPKNGIPASIVRRPPTAELRPRQKDQDTLPPYERLDLFLEQYIEKDSPIRAIIKKGVPAAEARELAIRVDGNEYKRRQAPPGVKITPKAFGRDRRMPITNRYRGGV